MTFEAFYSIFQNSCVIVIVILFIFHKSHWEYNHEDVETIT